MKTVVQKVLSASVAVEGETISSISSGLMCLVGISKDDTVQDMDYTIKKILNLRLWADQNNSMWKTSVKDNEGEILCVSQFTLYGSVKNNKPDFHKAMTSAQAKEFYDTFLEKLRQSYQPERIKDGKFGAMMQVSLVNDGPVTLTIDTSENGGGGSSTPSSTASSNINNLPTQQAKLDKLAEKARRKEEYERRLLEKQAQSSLSTQQYQENQNM